ncbi:MAG: tRNA epoxyqueuosine(34) reductase QueG [Gemmatimonadetes bacterium]|nr:MAG: tRNA epoxyqueuosine(34) reductase QueG [Gemmatimonadota bacterium]
MPSLSNQIKAKAKALGFCLVGIAPAEPLQSEADQLAEWLARGYHATMHWMERHREKRIDPAKLVPGAQSIIVVAMNYKTDYEPVDDPQVGKISRYACGDDYHEVLRPRLKALLHFIQTLVPAAEGRVFVDTAPMMDKVWAVRAGIGWQGKHTNVIHREWGSWFFLGEVVVNIELEYDTPILDYCGTCTRCLDACPTGAIVAPYQLNAERCISYQTIEHRGDLRADLVPDFQNWIFGCDICQEVCPWNQKFAPSTDEPAFQPRPENENRPLKEWMGLTEDDFRKRFRKSAVKRTKFQGFMRNVAAVADQAKGV